MNRRAVRIAVIGAGWAGLSCARLLQDAGLSPKVYEATKYVGGRARGMQISLGGKVHSLDNGQHLIVGAYACFRELFARYGDPQHAVFRSPDFDIRQSLGEGPAQVGGQATKTAQNEGPYKRMRLAQAKALQQWQAVALGGHSQPGRLRKALALSLAQLAWLQGAKRIPLKSLYELAALMRFAKSDPPRASCAVNDWLDPLQLKQSLVQRWIAALCESALNCPREQACALRLSTVLNEAMASAELDASHWLQQRCDLGELLAKPLLEGKTDSGERDRSGPLELHGSSRVLKLISSNVRPDDRGGDHSDPSSGWWLQIAGSEQLEGPFDHIVLALSPEQALALVQASLSCDNMPSLASLAKRLSELPKPLGILTRWILLPRKTMSDKQRRPELLLREQGAAAWLFPRSGSDCAGLVLSAQRDASEARRQADEIQGRFGIQAADFKDIYERQAATPSTHGMHWPAFDRFKAASLWLAGDWVGDGSGQSLPASLESSLRSARACAHAITHAMTECPSLRARFDRALAP